MNTFSIVGEYKTNKQKRIAFLLINNKYIVKEIRQTTLYSTVLQKYIGIN